MPVKIESKIDTTDHGYTLGDCHSFAIALNRLTGAPLVSFCKRYQVREDERLGDEEDDLYESEHAHAAVSVGSGLVVDCLGLRSVEEEDLLFTGCDFSDEPASELIMEVFGSREEDLASNYADYDEEIIRKAMIDAQKWGCDVIARKAMNAHKRVNRENEYGI